MAENLLLQAETLVHEFCQQLDQLLQQAGHQQQALEVQARQLRRLREEVEVRLTLAQSDTAPVTLDPGRLQAEQEEVLRQEQAALQDLAAAEQTSRRLELLLRQVGMSGRSLGDGAEHRPYDPWDLALRSQVLYGREQERAALAREVHDSPAQVLSNSVLGLERCRQAEVVEEIHTLADGVLRDVRLGLQEVRRFIYELRPSPLADEPLGRQLERYIQDFQTTYQVGVELHWSESPRAFSPEEGIAIYRIAQEALQNARKHSRADRVVVDTTVEPNGWVLRVSDNGVGFDPTAESLQQDHWGLRGMRERAYLIGADLQVAGRPHEGTTVTLRLPLRPPGRDEGRS